MTPPYQWRNLDRITARDAEAEPIHERLFVTTKETGMENVNLTGREFGLLTVIDEADVTIIHRNKFWKCRCTCGAIAYVSTTNLQHGYTKSCGCDAAEDRKR